VRDENALLDIESIFTSAFVKLSVNTMLSGHEQQDPDEHFKEHGIRTQKQKNKFYDWIEYNGQLRISDYGLKPLWNLFLELRSTNKPEEKIVACDKILNVIHMRSNMAANFVEGGRKSLDDLSGKQNENMLSEAVVEKHWFLGPNPASNMVMVKKFDDGYKILTVKRGGPTEHGKWSIPGGYQDTTAIGQADNPWKPGKETPLQTVIREVGEETNLEISSLSSKIKLVQQRKGFSPNNTAERWVQLTSYALFLPDSFDVSQAKALDDAADLKWISHTSEVSPWAFKDRDTIAKALQMLGRELVSQQ